MKFLLDFDGVILNIEGLKGKMAELGFQESERTADLFSKMKAADPTFDVRAFLFPDALSFLTAHKDDCFVVSSYISSKRENNQDESDARGYQEEKIKASGVTGLLGGERVHVVGHSKKEALTELLSQCKQGDEACLFVDDREAFVEEARSLGMPAFHMDKMSAERESAYTIASFDDLEEILKTWKM